jgi:hypothetical protein
MYPFAYLVGADGRITPKINCPEPDRSFVILVKQRTAIIQQKET